MIAMVRNAIALAEAEGLRFVEVESRSRHYFVVVENSKGQRFAAPVHKGRAAYNGCAKANDRARFRRFARGETHGLVNIRR